MVAIVACGVLWYKLKARPRISEPSFQQHVAETLEMGMNDMKRPNAEQKDTNALATMRLEDHVDESGDVRPSGRLRYPDAEVLESGRVAVWD
jgi:hypothetical protein